MHVRDDRDEYAATGTIPNLMVVVVAAFVGRLGLRFEPSGETR